MSLADRPWSWCGTRRGDLFNKRRRLMTEWARYCGSRPMSRTDVPYPHGVKRNWRGVIPVQRLNALVKELTSTYPNSHAISETGRSRSAR